MKLVKRSYEILSKISSSEEYTKAKFIVPFYEVQSLVEYFKSSSTSIDVVDKYEFSAESGLEFILPDNYKGSPSDLSNISNGSDILLQGLIESERKYMAMMYEKKVSASEAKLILPMSVATTVIVSATSESINRYISNKLWMR